MPRLSPKASELVRELWPRFSSNSEAIAWSHRKESRTTAWCLRLLRQLTGTGEPNAAPYVLGAYLQHDLPVATIAEMLDVLESRATAESLIGRERERAESDAWWDRDWPEVWEKLEPFRQQTGGWAAFATASLSRNGYIRERAVQALSQAVIDGREGSVPRPANVRPCPAGPSGRSLGYEVTDRGAQWRGTRAQPAAGHAPAAIPRPGRTHGHGFDPAVSLVTRRLAGTLSRPRCNRRASATRIVHARILH